MRATPRLALRSLGRSAALATALAAAGAAYASGEPPEDAVLATIPFHPSTPPTGVVIDLAPEGNKPFPLMLDTGSTASVMTPDVARDLGVSVRRIKSSPYRRKTVLGRDLQFHVDTASSDTGSGASFSYGVLGGDFVDDYVLEIDYPGRRVRFIDPEKFEVPESVSAPDERVLRFELLSTRIQVDLEIDGKPAKALLDTGMPPVLISGKIAKKLGIDWGRLPEFDGLAGVLGPIDTHVYETKSLAFAGFDFPGQPILIAPKGGYNQGGPNDSALGYDVLGQFILRIDYGRRRIWLRRDGTRFATLFGRTYAPGWATAEDEAPAPGTSHQPSSPTREEIERADRQRRAEWERQKATRVYAETTSGFVRVDGYRLRNGPKEGERWYSYEEMMELKAEREQAQDGQ